MHLSHVITHLLKLCSTFETQADLIKEHICWEPIECQDLIIMYKTHKWGVGLALVDLRVSGRVTTKHVGKDVITNLISSLKKNRTVWWQKSMGVLQIQEVSIRWPHVRALQRMRRAQSWGGKNNRLRASRRGVGERQNQKGRYGHMISYALVKSLDFILMQWEDAEVFKQRTDRFWICVIKTSPVSLRLVCKEQVVEENEQGQKDQLGSC